MNDYRISFSAASDTPLEPEAADRLAVALAATPGAGAVERADQHEEERLVSGAFWLKVRLGMADAARDGSRLAKEALKAAGMPDAQLVELAVSLKSHPGDRPTD